MRLLDLRLPLDRHLLRRHLLLQKKFPQKDLQIKVYMTKKMGLLYLPLM